MYHRGHMGCPVCGGIHPPGQCPYMQPPMPGFGGPPPYGGMMPPPGGMMPGMDMEEMMEKMKQHHELLKNMNQKINEIYNMCKDMYLKMAKG